MVKAPDFDSGIRRFESFLPSHFPIGQMSSWRLRALFRPLQAVTASVSFARLIHVLSLIVGLHRWRMNAYGRIFTERESKLAEVVSRHLNISLSDGPSSGRSPTAR